jgi:hypothetical protein
MECYRTDKVILNNVLYRFSTYSHPLLLLLLKFIYFNK